MWNFSRIKRGWLKTELNGENHIIKLIVIPEGGDYIVDILVKKFLVYTDVLVVTNM